MGQYRTAQVCLEGHPITDDIEQGTERMQQHCSKCGSKTITECASCHAPIRGYYFVPDIISIGSPYNPPSYCHSCGNAFPWTQSKINAAIELFTEFGNLEESEQKTIANDIQNIANDTARTEISARRIKRIWARTGQFAYSVLMEFASKTAAEILKN